MWSLDGNNHRQRTTPETLARHQHGYVTRRQLLDAGLTTDAIEYRVRTGRLLSKYRGVYGVGHLPHSLQAHAMAAVLACGDSAVLSHASAAALWDFGRWRTPVDVTVPTKRRQQGIRVHRSRTLTEEQVTHHHGIPITTAARTILDLAPSLDDTALTRAVNDARLQHRLNLADLAELAARSPGRATSRLKPLIEPTNPTRSALEDTFRRLVRRYGLPEPEINAIVAGYEVDVLWREQRLVVELDGREYHDLRAEEDREKDAALLAAGFPVVRITPRRLEQPRREADRLRGLLAQPR